MEVIKVGDKFKTKTHPDYIYERIEDDSNPEFECERIRVKVIYPAYMKQTASGESAPPSIIAVESEWFNQRGLKAE